MPSGIAQWLAEKEISGVDYPIGKHIIAAIGVIPYGTYKTIKESLSLLKRLPEIQQGVVLDPEGYATEVLELVGLGIAGGARGGLPKGATGTGIFYGAKGAKQVKHIESLHKAIGEYYRGRPPAKIRRETGWFKSPYDKQWRFEIDDSKMKFLQDMSKKQYRFKETTLGELIKHEELFQAYPNLKKMPVRFEAIEGQSGSIMMDKIYINPFMDENLTKQILVHEIQHTVQQIEGFAQGGSPAVVPGFSHKESLKNYRLLAGEIEAREAADRQGLTGMLREYVEPFGGTMNEPHIAPSSAIIKME